MKVLITVEAMAQLSVLPLLTTAAVIVAVAELSALRLCSYI